MSTTATIEKPTTEKPKRGGARAEPGTVLIVRSDKHHCVARVAADLLPKEMFRKDINFKPEVDKENAVLRLTPMLRSDENDNMWGILRAYYNHPAAASPRVSVQNALKALGLRPRRHNTTIKAKKLDDGRIEIQFPREAFVV